MNYSSHRPDKKGRMPWNQLEPNMGCSKEFLAQCKKIASSPKDVARYLRTTAAESAPGGDKGRPPRRTRVPVVTLAPKDVARIRAAFDKAKGKGTCAAIRALAPHFPVGDVLQALPELSPSTVRIQHKAGSK